jgi:hypothetical protein
LLHDDPVVGDTDRKLDHVDERDLETKMAKTDTINTDCKSVKFFRKPTT